MRKSTATIRSFRDSQRKLAICRRRYMDALKKYQDAEEEVEIKKTKSLLERGAEKLGKFKQNHPTVGNLIKVLLKIESLLSAASAGGAAATGIMALSKKGQAYLNELNGEGTAIPYGVGVLIGGALRAAISYATWKLSKF